MKSAALALVCAALSCAQSDLAHSHTAFHLTVPLPYAQAAPLFGAWAEQKWAADWHPRFLYPSPPADQEGAIFQVEHGSHSSIWMTTIFDLPAGRIQYVYVLDQLLITRIDITLAPQSADKTSVSVTYERTALDPSANARVLALAKHDSEQAPEWQSALDAYAGKLRNQPR
jgi:hypothetical protein